MAQLRCQPISGIRSNCVAASTSTGAAATSDSIALRMRTCSAW